MPVVFGSSWTQGSGNSANKINAEELAKNNSAARLVLMGFFGGLRAPPYYFSCLDPPIKISNGLGIERLIMGPNAMCPFIPFLINCLAKWHISRFPLPHLTNPSWLPSWDSWALDPPLHSLNSPSLPGARPKIWPIFLAGGYQPWPYSGPSKP